MNKPQKRISQATFLLLIVLFSNFTMAYDKIGRLGIGYTNQLKNNIPAISFKTQRNRSVSFGGFAGLSSDSTSGGSGFGLKVYRNIFDEPQLNFYVAGMGALINSKVNSTSYSGFQIDVSFGSEFHLTGLNSIGFSFEFGASATKTKDFVFQTLGNSFIVSGIHFYL